MTMESTPMEEMFRAFLQAHKDGTYSTNLGFLNSIYTDKPRQDITRSTRFPQVSVQELLSPSDRVHNTSMREYEAHMSLLIFLEMNSILNIDGADVSPEVACSRIGYKIIDLISNNWTAQLFTGSNPFYPRTLAYQKMGIDNEYFEKMNVFKGSVEVSGKFWR
jgi:hypothetical protein